MKTAEALYNVLLDYTESQEKHNLCQSCRNKVAQISGVNPELLRLRVKPEFAFQVTYEDGNSDVVAIFSNEEKTS